MKLYLKSCERFHWPFDDASTNSFKKFTFYFCLKTGPENVTIVRTVKRDVIHIPTLLLSNTTIIFKISLQNLKNMAAVIWKLLDLNLFCLFCLSRFP